MGGSQFLESHQQLAETVDPRECSFYDPAAWLGVRIRLLVPLLVFTAANMGDEPGVLHDLAARLIVVAAVETQMLRCLRRRRGPVNDRCCQGLGEERQVRSIGASDRTADG